MREENISGPSPRGWGKPRGHLRRGQTSRTIPTRVGKTSAWVNSVVAEADHPHAGGENDITGGGIPSVSGPSPRGWGKRRLGRLPARDDRTIPTRVGKTNIALAATGALADHPHAGGENPKMGYSPERTAGPSPRGWGKPFWATASRMDCRTIPTRVGKTTRFASICRCSSDHPHAGGENNNRDLNELLIDGPSPRGWGKR